MGKAQDEYLPNSSCPWKERKETFTSWAMGPNGFPPPSAADTYKG